MGKYALALVFLLMHTSCIAAERSYDRDTIVERLKAGYPEFVDRLDGDKLLFKDQSWVVFDDHKSKDFEQWLGNPDVKDMFRLGYPLSVPQGSVPDLNFDPGRARDASFFKKVYGDCSAPGFSKSLVEVDWLPGKSKEKLLVTRKNGVDKKLREVISELVKLPREFDKFLIPSAGTFVCRSIAGTDQRSAHGYGIAIDISVAHSSYWRWAPGGPSGRIAYRNQIPPEIVHIFEKHGFIWGGRWFHYDTMHFEYRPELFAKVD
jgi:D-alanyl-D-alanine carboxypeptidase